MDNLHFPQKKCAYLFLCYTCYYLTLTAEKVNKQNHPIGMPYSRSNIFRVLDRVELLQLFFYCRVE